MIGVGFITENFEAIRRAVRETLTRLIKKYGGQHGPDTAPVFRIGGAAVTHGAPGSGPDPMDRLTITRLGVVDEYVTREAYDRVAARRDELAGICHRAHEAAGLRPEQPWSDIPAAVAFHRARSEGGAP